MSHDAACLKALDRSNEDILSTPPDRSSWNITRVSRTALSALAATALALSLTLITGCAHSMTTPGLSQHEVDGNLLPLRFKQHNFAVYVYNTRTCTVVYNRYDYTRMYERAPSGPPSSPDYREKWNLSGHVGIRNFPPSAEISWTASDGSSHQATVDIAALFRDERVHYTVKDEEIAAGLYPQGIFLDPLIILEVNDRTISVFMKAAIPTRKLQIPGNKYSDFRDDTVLVWTHTY